MSLFETKQISHAPPRFETIADLHFYSSANIGWYKISVVAMGPTKDHAERSAELLYRQAQVAMSVAFDNRVPEAQSAEG